MKNQELLLAEEMNHINLQVGPDPDEWEEEDNQDDGADDDDAGYTPEEDEFADGEGTRLFEESETLETDEEDEDFENPEDDPA
jgi:hypothetical protein